MTLPLLPLTSENVCFLVRELFFASFSLNHTKVVLFFNTLSFSVHQQHMITVYTNTSSVRTPKHGTTSPLGGDSEYMVMSQVLLSGPVKRYRGSS